MIQRWIEQDTEREKLRREKVTNWDREVKEKEAALEKQKRDEARQFRLARQLEEEDRDCVQRACFPAAPLPPEEDEEKEKNEKGKDKEKEREKAAKQREEEDKKNREATAHEYTVASDLAGCIIM